MLAFTGRFHGEKGIFIFALGCGTSKTQFLLESRNTVARKYLQATVVQSLLSLNFWPGAANRPNKRKLTALYRMSTQLIDVNENKKIFLRVSTYAIFH